MDKLNITIILALQVCQTTINMFAINEIQGAVGILNTCEGISGASIAAFQHFLLAICSTGH
jgi:hypothetical protein